MIKNSIKKIINRLGYNIYNRKIIGSELYDDIMALLTKKDLVIFDVGANKGQTTLELVSKFPQAFIYSFEPDSNTFEKLVKKVEKFKSVRTYNIGFGEKNEHKQLNINKASGGNSLLELSEKINTFTGSDWTKKIDSMTVKIETIDDFCFKNNINCIDVLKIDTQGYEKQIIEGGERMISPTKTKVIFIEVLFVELYKEQVFFDEIYQMMQSRGYKLLGLYNKFYKEEKPNYLLWCDAIFVAENF